MSVDSITEEFAADRRTEEESNIKESELDKEVEDDLAGASIIPDDEGAESEVEKTQRKRRAVSDSDDE
jgi:hypothetical protein